MNSKKDEAIQALFAPSPDAVLGVRGGRGVFSNPAACRLFGRETVGESLLALLPSLPALPTESGAATAFLGDEERRVTLVWQGDLLVVTILRGEAAPAPVPEGSLARMRTAAFNLRFSLDRLLGIAERSDPYSAVLYRSYHTLLHTIEQLSDANELAAGTLSCGMQGVDLRRLVRDLADSTALLLQGKNVSLQTELPEEACLVTGDRRRLQQLVLILLSNGLLHTPEGGRILLRLEQRGTQVFLTVDDNGEGIAPEALAYVFSVPEDVSPAYGGGAGLGLQIAQGIARLHGGALALQSTPGQGTRVSLRLPAAKHLSLRDAVSPAPEGPGLLLTELCDVLPQEAYYPKYRD